MAALTWEEKTLCVVLGLSETRFADSKTHPLQGMGTKLPCWTPETAVWAALAGHNSAALHWLETHTTSFVDPAAVDTFCDTLRRRMADDAKAGKGDAS